MFEWIKLFPTYLIFLTLVFVIIPAILSSLIRITLYKYLQNSAERVKRLITGKSRGKQPTIVEKLEIRFKQASGQLESVNTLALIEGIYSEEEFSFLSKSLRCEQWDYFTKILPNLLLAFGLLGTFLGITLNLTNISEIIHQGNVDNINLVQNLQAPLQSMGIAFITSLIALFFSSVLTVINLRCNTSLAKNGLMNFLEDYLDNIFHPTVEGNSRLDKAVNRMVEQQHEFLTRFHEKVGQVLESTLKPVANRIADENEKSNRTAIRVYEKFMEASGTLANGATTFERAAISLEQQVQKMTNITSSVHESSQKLESSAVTFKEASERVERSKFSENLENLTAYLAETQKEFSQSTSLLGQHIVEIIDSNKKANNLAEQVYNQLQDSSVKLQDSAIGFLEASEKIEKSQFADKLASATTDLVTSHRQFTESSLVLHQSTQSIASLVQDLQISTQRMVNLGDQIFQLNQQSTELLELNHQQIVIDGERFKSIQSELSQLIESVNSSQEKTRFELRELGNSLVSNIDKQLGSNSENLQQVSQTIEQSAKYLEETKIELSHLLTAVDKNTNVVNKSIQSLTVKLVETLKNSQEATNFEFRALGNSLVNNIHDQLSNNSKNLKQVSISIDQSANSLNEIKSALAQLFTAVNNNINSLNMVLQFLNLKLSDIVK